MPSFALADDWLAVWPSCSIEDASRPSLSLLYPAPGLPAVVRAGDTLTIRLRTPAALTPPPGVQQAEVLARWTGELTGSALQAGVDARARHRHMLSVMSLRPDASDSLVYRLRIAIPAYVAPGTYAFAIRTPFGTRSTEQAVRVLAADTVPRVARLPSGVLLPPPAAGTWPVDVWLAGSVIESPREAAPSPASDASDPAPTLLSEGTSVALRVGRELWVRSGCSDDAAFEREVAAVLASEGLARVAFDSARAIAPPAAASLFAPLPISFRDGRAAVDNRASDTSRELSVLLPFESRVTADAGTLAFYPSTEPGARLPTAKLARWIVPAGAQATLDLGPATDERKPLALRPRSVRSGQPAEVRVLGARSGAKVAFTLGAARSAYASPDLHTSFSGPLTHPVRAQVFEPDGTGQVAQGHLWVEPHRPPNCAIERPGQPRSPASLATTAVALALAVLVRSRRSAKKGPPKPALE